MMLGLMRDLGLSPGQDRARCLTECHTALEGP